MQTSSMQPAAASFEDRESYRFIFEAADSIAPKEGSVGRWEEAPCSMLHRPRWRTDSFSRRVRTGDFSGDIIADKEQLPDVHAKEWLAVPDTASPISRFAPLRAGI
jgi:hypothetical protein